MSSRLPGDCTNPDIVSLTGNDILKILRKTNILGSSLVPVKRFTRVWRKLMRKS